MGEISNLGLDNIFQGDELENLFIDTEESSSAEAEEQQGGNQEPPEENTEQNITTEAIDPETLFAEEKPESVGSGKEESKEKEDTTPDEGDGSSPNFYSSIANALAVDGIFPNLDEETVKKADSAEALSELITAEVEARLNDDQQRVLKALENGVPQTDIQAYENTLKQLDGITETFLTEESAEGEDIRRRLILQDYLNKGYTKERASKLTDRAFTTGTDLEDAKDALQSNKEFFKSRYNDILKEAEAKATQERTEQAERQKALEKSMMKDKQLLGDIEISNEVRKKAYEAISKPVYKDPETGKYLTAIQKYEMENRGDFLKYAGLLFTLTNGFKDFDSFVKGKVKKETKKGLRELEQTLRGSKTPSGAMTMVSKENGVEESIFGKGVQLAI